MDKKTAKAIRRLTSKMFLLGPFLREKGAVALSATDRPEAVAPLVNALTDPKEKVRVAAYQTLMTLQGGAIDQLCALWDDHRDQLLESIITDGNFVAESPKRLKYLICLMRNLTERMVDADASGVDTLISLMNDKDQRVAANSKNLLRKLHKQDGIDRLCALWDQNRDDFLKKMILECRYIAVKPTELYFKTSYLYGIRPEKLPDEDILMSCLSDTEKLIRKNVLDHELSIGTQSDFERLWKIALQHPDSEIAQALLTVGYFPSDAVERALFYFLAGAMDQYHDIDFDQCVLRTWYENGGTVLKETIARRIRQSGDARLLSVFRSQQEGPKKALSANEVEVQLSILIKHMNFKGLFDLLPYATYAQATRMMMVLKEAGWVHPDRRSAELQSRLEAVLTQDRDTQGPSSYALGMFRDFRPMFFGKEQLPETEAQLMVWGTDETDFRRRSAALISMAENKSPSLSDMANTACGDAYWQVRMAAAAAELLRPGTLSPTNRALLSDDHVFWVQALMKMPADGRLSELGPSGLDMLSQDAEFSGSENKPSEPDDFMTKIRGLISAQERAYLLILGEYFSTEGEFSEDSPVNAGLTDVEVIFEQ